MKTQYIITLILIQLLTNCSTNPETQLPVANKADYDPLIKNLATKKAETLTKYNASIAFWQQKLNKQPNGYLYMQKLAGLYQKIFAITGGINQLNLATKLLVQAEDLVPTTSVGLKHQLAANAISKHEFQSALSYQFDALEIGEKQYLSNLLLFDGLMETGAYQSAAKQLKKLHDKGTFGYLIRAAKHYDHLGDLDTAIFNMELAVSDVSANKGELYLWALSNLADMYGHAGKIEKSYNCYLKVLQVAPDYDYALKGIAWIVFSNDKNPKEAKRILSIIQANRKSSPDITLLLAEIAEYEGNDSLRQWLINQFKHEVSQQAYGKMYTKHLALIAAEEEEQFSVAIQLAGKEIKNRPVPQSYDLLAWSYYQMGDINKAYAIGKNYVHGETFEPEVAYHLGLIYHAAGKEIEAKRQFKEAQNSAFELGPNIMRNIASYVN